MPVKGLHANGYDEVTAAKLSNVKLPDKIRCLVCRKWRGPQQFSKKQLSDFRYKTLQHYTNIAIKCRLCTGAQVQELNCIVCDQIKGLEEFTQTQRRDPDNARCKICIDEQLAVEPGLEDEDEDDAESEDTNPWHVDNTDSDVTSSEGGAWINEVTARLDNVALVKHDSTTGSKSRRYGSNASRVVSTGTPVPDSIQGSVGGQKENIWQAWAASNAKGSKHSANYTWASTVGHSSKADDSGNLAGHDFNSKGKEKESTFPAYDISGRGHSRMLSESTITTTPAYSATSERSVQIDNTHTRFPKPSKTVVQVRMASKSDYESKKFIQDEIDDEDDEDDEDYLGVANSTSGSMC